MTEKKGKINLNILLIKVTFLSMVDVAVSPRPVQNGLRNRSLKETLINISPRPVQNCLRNRSLKETLIYVGSRSDK